MTRVRRGTRKNQPTKTDTHKKKKGEKSARNKATEKMQWVRHEAIHMTGPMLCAMCCVLCAGLGCVSWPSRDPPPSPVPLSCGEGPAPWRPLLSHYGCCCFDTQASMMVSSLSPLPSPAVFLLPVSVCDTAKAGDGEGQRRLLTPPPPRYLSYMPLESHTTYTQTCRGVLFLEVPRWIGTYLASSAMAGRALRYRHLQEACRVSFRPQHGYVS